MALMDALKAQNEKPVAPAVADEKAEKKAKAKERKAAKKDALTKLIDWAEKNAPEDIKTLAASLKPRAGATTGGFGPSVFNVIFGETPKVGDVKTSLEIFNQLGKGHAEMRHHIKKWAEKGNIVEFDAEKKAYKITKLA